jgi:hypothetical protein
MKGLRYRRFLYPPPGTFIAIEFENFRPVADQNF